MKTTLLMLFFVAIASPVLANSLATPSALRLQADPAYLAQREHFFDSMRKDQRPKFA
jgi:hypothetical protein